MKMNHFFNRLAGSVLPLLALCATASATDVLNVNGIITASDAAQQGRLARNGIPQDWSGSEPFPGITGTANTYHYDTYLIPENVSQGGRFYQISLLDLGPDNPGGQNLFVSAYANSYLPNSSPTGNRGFNTNWLGDAGFSGNVFGVNAVFFQVLVPAGANLVIVINNSLTSGNGGINENYNLLVENFSDNQFSPAGPVPEGGATALLLAIGAVGVFVVRRRVVAQA
jgi:hypothetical protein